MFLAQGSHLYFLICPDAGSRYLLMQLCVYYNKPLLFVNKRIRGGRVLNIVWANLLTNPRPTTYSGNNVHDNLRFSRM